MTPEALYQLIVEHSQVTADPESIATALNSATVDTPLTQRVTTATLLDGLEPDEYGTVRTVLAQAANESPYVAGIQEALAGQGVLFSDSRSLQFIEQLRPQLGDSIADKLKAMGVSSVPVVDEVVTVDAVVDAIAVERLRKRFVNAVALAGERVVHAMSASEMAEAWTEAWEASGV